MSDSPAPTHQLLQALHFAADKHRDQRRKGEDASPYINHPIFVAEILSRAGVTDVVTLQAAVLHDTIEDTETTPEELEQVFGAEVGDVVLEVTDDKQLRTHERREAQIRCAADLSRRAKLVRIADKIANVHDMIHRPPDWPLDWRISYLDWTEEVVRQCRGINPDLDREYRQVLAEGRSRLGA